MHGGCAKLAVSERRACRTLGQHRSTQRKPRLVRQDEDVLTAAIIHLAEQFGRYGYRRITALLRRDGWHVNEKRVYRIWRREGLKIPKIICIPQSTFIILYGISDPINTS